jgi:hypothetical protein
VWPGHYVGACTSRLEHHEAAGLAHDVRAHLPPRVPDRYEVWKVLAQLPLMVSITPRTPLCARTSSYGSIHI